MSNHLGSLISSAKHLHEEAQKKLTNARLEIERLHNRIPDLEDAAKQYEAAHYGLIKIAGDFSGE